MELKQIVFSPTGGTGKVADILANEWEGSVTRIDLSDAKTDFSKIEIGQEDIVLAVVPSYGGRVPGLAAERLTKIRGNQARCIIVCVYGNRAYEDTLVELQDIAENCGFQTVAAVCAVAEHSIMRQYAAGRPDGKDAEELRGFAQKIYGNRDNLKTADPKKCISCMRCVAGCPKAVRKVNGAMVSAAALAMKKVCSERKGNELFLSF